MIISPVSRAVIGLALIATITALAGCITVNTPLSGGGNALHETTVSGDGAAKILWLPISGFISASPSSQAFGLVEQPSTLARISEALDKARQDTHIKVLVLRIDSPGGTVSASDEIYAAIRRYHQQTGVPVITSLGGLAASGGFYIAMAGDPVIAEPTTITGSIGVILFDVNAHGLLDKIGVTNETVKSAPNKDILSPLNAPTADQRAIVQRVVDSLYARFVSVVKERRPNLDQSQSKKIFDGRIFAADDAKQLGLVDQIGHIPDVIDAAQSAAGVKQARVIRYYYGGQAPRTIVAAAAGTSADARSGIDLGQAALLAALDRRADGQPLYLWRTRMANADHH